MRGLVRHPIVQTSVSEGPSAHFFGNVFCGSHGKCQDGQRRILFSSGDERGGVHREQVLDVVTLVEFVEDGLPGIVAHPRAGFAGKNKAREPMGDLAI